MDSVRISRKYCDAGVFAVQCVAHGYSRWPALLGHVWRGLHGHLAMAWSVSVAQPVAFPDWAIDGLRVFGRCRCCIHELAHMVGRANRVDSPVVEHDACDRGVMGFVAGMAR